MTSRGSKHGIDRETWRGEAWMYAPRGNRLPHARLTPELVREIRASNEPHKQISARLGVHHMTIQKVRRYETWRHVR